MVHDLAADLTSEMATGAHIGKSSIFGLAAAARLTTRKLELAVVAILGHTDLLL